MMNKTRTGYAVGSLLQDDMAVVEEGMGPDGLEFELNKKTCQYLKKKHT
jgi:hypothetical protein